MKIRVRDLRLSLDHKEKDLLKAVASRLEINKEHIKDIKLIRKAVDARRKKVCFSYTVDLKIENIDLIPEKVWDLPEISIMEEKKIPELHRGSNKLEYSPLIVGSGPAGLFCALTLARMGYKPVMIEQGQDIDHRVRTVEKIWKEGILNDSSNTQFGEGGAGTFSDGKLTTRIGDYRVEQVLETFVNYGANEEILYMKKPHVGTDKIRQVVKKIRKEIIDLGGKVYFNTKLTGININKESLQSIIIDNGIEIPCSLLVLAVGNSARDIYKILYSKGINLIPKAFALGVRIEHPQDTIDKIQYGNYAGHPHLGAADYHFTYQDRSTGRSLYTFCMCPGGYVIGGSSGPGQVVTNGMSYFKRDSGVANSALVATVNPSDWNNETLGGINLQEELERKAFIMGGENYHAPAQYLKDFLEGEASTSLQSSLATYKPGVTPVNLWNLLPRQIGEVMRRGIMYWGNKADGFINDEAVMTGIETRTSAPVRIVRDEKYRSVSIDGIYPCGEGAGYAGGIVSAAVDGIKVAESIISSYSQVNYQIEINKNFK